MEVGGCIVFEALNPAVKLNEISNNFYPHVRSCSSMANFACEGDGAMKDYLGLHLPPSVFVFCI
jgi:hypothetical protein